MPEGGGPPKCTFGHDDPENSKRHFGGPRPSKKHHRNSTRIRPERPQRVKFQVGEGTKNWNFAPLPTLLPLSSPHPTSLFLGLGLRAPPPFRPPHSLGPPLFLGLGPRLRVSLMLLLLRVCCSFAALCTAVRATCCCVRLLLFVLPLLWCATFAFLAAFCRPFETLLTSKMFALLVLLCCCCLCCCFWAADR